MRRSNGIWGVLFLGVAIAALVMAAGVAGRGSALASFGKVDAAGVLASDAAPGDPTVALVGGPSP